MQSETAFNLTAAVAKITKNIFRNTDLQICSCFNRFTKEEKAKTKYTHDLCFALCLLQIN